MYYKNFSIKNIIGLSFLLTSVYYFYKYSIFANKNFIIFFIDLSILFLSTLGIFFLVKFIIKKIEYNFSNKKFIDILLIAFSSYLSVQSLKGFIFLINNKLTLSGLLIKKIFYIFEFNNLVSDRLLIYFTPYILFFVFYFIFKIKISKIIKFISIIGYVFLSILFFREFDNNLKINNKINENSLKIINTESIKNSNKDKKVIWIIFDGFDPQIAFNPEKEIILPNFKNILETSVFGKNFYSPAKSTINSVPALLLGSQTRGHIIKDGKYYLKDQNLELIQLSFKNSIFGKLNQLGLKSSIFSSVLEYCTAYLKSNEYLHCKEREKDHNYVTTKRYFEGVFFTFSFINKIKYLIQWPKEINNKPTKTNHNYNDYNDLKIYNKNFDEDDVDGYKTIFYSEINQSIKDSNLIFIHLFIPHPGNYEHAKNVFNRLPIDDLDSHMLNLKLSDIAIGKIISLIPDIDNTMIVIASDHWLRSKDKNPKNIYPAMFLAKIMNDNKKITINKNSSSIYIKELILKYLKSEINNHDDINSFIKEKPMHQTFIKKDRDDTEKIIDIKKLLKK